MKITTEDIKNLLYARIDWNNALIENAITKGVQIEIHKANLEVKNVLRDIALLERKEATIDQIIEGLKPVQQVIRTVAEVDSGTI